MGDLIYLLWKCAGCGLRNTAPRAHCFRCGLARHAGRAA
jgi:hypothetical protein